MTIRPGPDGGAAHRSVFWPLVAVALCAVFGACRDDEAEDDGRATMPITLSPETVFTDDALGWVVELALAGDRLVALDALLDPAVHVLDLARSRRLGSYGRSGDGPGEFKDPEQIITGATDSHTEVWVLDGVHQRLTRLSLADIEGRVAGEPATFRIEGPNAGSLVRGRGGRWFSGGWVTDGRVARFHEDLVYDRTIVGFPPEAAEAPGTALPQAYESKVVADPAGGRLAVATVLGGLLEIVDHDGVPVARAHVPDPFQPAWAQGRSRSGRAVMSVSPETRYGFTDLAATRRYLYGLFSGRRVMEDGTPWATREVQVYTWVGRRVTTLHLNRDAEAITIDDSDTWLYASGPEPTPWVARFPLPSQLR